MDSITNALINNFIEKLGFPTTIDLSTRFEYFATHSILSHEVNSSIFKNDLDNLSVGKAKGIDSIAFCINEKLIFNSEEVDNFAKQSLKVDAFFIQAKITEGFSDSETGNFLDVVIDFFSDQPKYIIKEFDTHKEIYKKILEKIGSIREFNLHCFYVSLGAKQEVDTTIDSTISIKKQAFTGLNLFKTIRIELVDKAALIKKHKKAINPLIATFKFDNKIPLNNIQNVDEAYIGFIPFSEFKNLIMDEEQDKIKSLFNDNLRDFLGLENSINQGIKSTIENGRFNEFSLLNNGITVIADTNNGRGNTLILENYQIVNGCQTSNVLYECRNVKNIDNVLIPLKVVITTDDTLRDSIILSTNSQSRFTEEQLFAITEFQKTLEDFYYSNKTKDGFYYERRTNQYTNSNIGRNNIIEIKEQLKSFMAMFHDIPHVVAGNIGKVIANYQTEFFQKEHKPLPYYIAGLTSINWEKLLQNEVSYKEFNKYRYHIFMGFRYVNEDVLFQKSFLQNTKNYSVKREDGTRENSYDKLLNTLRNPAEFKKSIDVVIGIFKQSEYSRPKGAYSNPITQEFIKNLQTYINKDVE